MSEALDVGKKLVGMCQKGDFRGAIEGLYGAEIVSVEASGPPGQPLEVKGIEAVRKKTEWWEANHEVHSAKVEGPWPHGERFIVRFSLDVTGKTGPMAGKRFQMEEAGLYTVKNGKVVREEFFYSFG